MSSLPHFYYHPRMLAYKIGDQHPLKPERLRRAIELLRRYGVAPIDPGEGDPQDSLRVHSPDYVDAVLELDPVTGVDPRAPELAAERIRYGFGSGDNPPFANQYKASLAYLAGTVRAAEAVRDGANLAFGLAGGLHHARHAKASGFCVFNDPAVAVHVLRERFERVAYVDIDVHHGDGVQWLWYDEPTVLTCSIHEDGRTLFPGTGFVEETGRGFSAVNVPLEAKTSGDVWLWAFRRGILPALKRFRPGAIVLQMGTDPHFLDPLGHLHVSVQDWLSAVTDIRDLGVPVVAVGGGGYSLKTVPRMWAAACLTLGRVSFEERLPEDLAEEWGVETCFDDTSEIPRGVGSDDAEIVVGRLEREVLPFIGA